MKRAVNNHLSGRGTSRGPDVIKTLKLLEAIAGVAFFLHFVWEMWQIPLYVGMVEASHGDAVWLCTKATIGDVFMASLAYGAGALVARRFDWLMAPPAVAGIVYLASGLMMTVVLEYLATEVNGRWAYVDAMPRLPVLGTGIAPVLQWVILPMMTLYVSRVVWRGLTLKQD
ncbi:MAG: hypothetical protein HUJ31_04000 [Pseudomonadales bacterium]|nr:hypothetical protein [Pseudomonadales bacterium]